MNTFTQPKKHSNDIESILGINEMSEEEQAIFFDNIGAMVIESATLRFTMTLTQEERFSFEQWLEDKPTYDDLIVSACEAYPQFGELLSEEIQNFHSEASKLLTTVL